MRYRYFLTGRSPLRTTACCAVVIIYIAGNTFVSAQGVGSQSSAASRMQSIGSSGLLEAYRSQYENPRITQSVTRQVGYRAAIESPQVAQASSGGNAFAQHRSHPAVQRTVWMQQMGMPDTGMPSAGGQPMSSPGAALPNSALPGTPNAGLPADNLPESMPFTETTPRSLPSPQPTSTLAENMAVPSPSDTAPMDAPSLRTNSFARMDNCNLITPPSQYMAASVYGGCGSVAPMGYAVVAPTSLPAEIAAPATMPPLTTTVPVATAPPTIATAVPSAAAPARALVSFGQERLMVQIGQGLWGQPVAYVPGQSVRNWLRYFSP